MANHRDSSKRKRKITDEDITEYLTKKVAKKLTSSSNQQALVWRKKIERDVMTQGVSVDQFSVRMEKKRQKERLSEIEKLKKRKEERDVERARREEEMSLLARERASAEFHDWQKKEDEFAFQQCKNKSMIRIREGRPKPVDLLAMYLDDSLDDGFCVEPCKILQGLPVGGLEDLLVDLKMYASFDQERVRYWESLLVVCQWEIRIRKMVPEERGLHGSIEADVEEFLLGKEYGELEDLQSQIEARMQTGDAKVVEFWEAVLKRLPLYKSKAFLDNMHAKNLEKSSRRIIERPAESLYGQNESSLEADKQDSDENERSDGSYSPRLLHGDEDEDAIDPEEDKAVLERRRIAILEQQASREDEFKKNALKSMGAVEEDGNELGLKDEITVDSKAYWWHDKYRPRKPKYFNRVHTGYAWNKYNQTHYDHDNPPPKTVQGYKFNVFYPELVDKSKAPTYTIEKDVDSVDDTCIIRFHAGPPYEDIAFRIVSKEWEYSRKKGFKCSFERGILQLHFNLKHYRYRR